MGRSHAKKRNKCKKPKNVESSTERKKDSARSRRRGELWRNRLRMKGMGEEEEGGARAFPAQPKMGEKGGRAELPRGNTSPPLIAFLREEILLMGKKTCAAEPTQFISATVANR